MRRHAMLLSFVGVLLLTLSIPAVAKPHKGGPPGPPDQIDLPACTMIDGAVTFPDPDDGDYPSMCEWLPTQEGVWTFTVTTSRTVHLQLGLKDGAPGNACAVVDARDSTLSLTYHIEKTEGSYANICPQQENEPYDWGDDDEEFVIWAFASPSRTALTVTITPPTVP